MNLPTVYRASGIQRTGDSFSAGQKRRKRSTGCRFVKGGGCLCNGRFRKKSGCRR